MITYTANNEQPALNTRGTVKAVCGYAAEVAWDNGQVTAIDNCGYGKHAVGDRVSLKSATSKISSRGYYSGDNQAFSHKVTTYYGRPVKK